MLVAHTDTKAPAEHTTVFKRCAGFYCIIDSACTPCPAFAESGRHLSCGACFRQPRGVSRGRHHRPGARPGHHPARAVPEGPGLRALRRGAGEEGRQEEPHHEALVDFYHGHGKGTQRTAGVSNAYPNGPGLAKCVPGQ